MATPRKRTVKRAAKVLRDKRTGRDSKSAAGYTMRDAKRKKKG